MRQTSIILLFAFVLAGTTPALAQRRVPNTGMGAIGASIGAALPTETNLENGLELAGNLEGYLTPRVSIRGQVGTAWLDFTGGAATARPLFVLDVPWLKTGFTVEQVVERAQQALATRGQPSREPA